MELEKEFHLANPQTLEELLEHKNCVADIECVIISTRAFAFETVERIIELEKALGIKRT